MAIQIQLQQDTALALWRDVLGESVRRDAPDLSARQMAIMLLVYTTDAPHTVRRLAGDLNIAKPAVTRALDRLSEFGLIRRQRDDADKRSVIVRRTVKGTMYLSEFASLVTAAGQQFAIPMPEPQPPHRSILESAG